MFLFYKTLHTKLCLETQFNYVNRLVSLICNFLMTKKNHGKLC